MDLTTLLERFDRNTRLIDEMANAPTLEEYNDLCEDWDLHIKLDRIEDRMEGKK